MNEDMNTYWDGFEDTSFDDWVTLVEFYALDEEDFEEALFA